MAITITPFIVAGKIPAKYFCDRKEESKRLIDCIENQENVVLISPRRMGKSKLIDYCFDKSDIRNNYYTLQADILQTTSLQEFKALVFESLAYEGSGITAELALQRQVYRFLELLSQRLKQTSLITESRRVNPYVQQVLELLSSHLPESLSVQELAQKLALHPSYLSRLFKDEVGKGIKEYSNDLRLNMAADLLTSSQLSVEEIASKTGFAGTQSFSKAFKKARGQSPLNFRKASSHLGQEL